MFSLFKRLRKVEKEVLGTEKKVVLLSLGHGVIPRRPGLLERVSKLEAENAKLKAVVAELTDYTYREKE